MKRILLTMGLWVICFGAIAQRLTSSAAQTTFETLHPSVAPIWEWRGDCWVAMLPAPEGLALVFIDQAGNWLETRYRLSLNSFSEEVIEFIRRHYGQAEIVSAGQVMRTGGPLPFPLERECFWELVIRIPEYQEKRPKEMPPPYYAVASID